MAALPTQSSERDPLKELSYSHGYIDARAEPPGFTTRRGINLYYQTGQRLSQVRAFGTLVLSGATYDAFSEPGGTIQIARQISLSVAQHCADSLRNAGGVAQTVAQAATWTSLFSHSAEERGSMGVGADVTVIDANPQPFFAFVNAIREYYLNQGYEVTPIFVTNGWFPAGMPAEVTQVWKRGLDGRQTPNQICSTPVDLRQYFTNDAPAVPDSYATC